MGSSLSIFNNTRDTYLVTVVATTTPIITTTALLNVYVAQVNRLLVSQGQRPSIAATTVSPTVIQVSGFTRTSLHPAVDLANTIQGAGSNIKVDARGWASSLVVLTSDYLINSENYEQLQPGQRARHSGTLSLIRQAGCFRIRVDPQNPVQVSIDYLNMHPIFTGPTDGSDNVYHMQAWMDANNGFTTSHIIHLDPASLQALSCITPNVQSSNLKWLQVYEEMCWKTKQEELEKARKTVDIGVLQNA